MRIPTRQEISSQLTFACIDKIPASHEVYLIDEGRARTVNLRQDSLYRFTPAAEISKFNVVVGRKDAVQEKLSAVVLPKEFALGHTWPNLFSANGIPTGVAFGKPVTTIPVAVPTTSRSNCWSTTFSAGRRRPFMVARCRPDDTGSLGKEKKKREIQWQPGFIFIVYRSKDFTKFSKKSENFASLLLILWLYATIDA